MQEEKFENSKMKPATILYGIDNLARGGAETLLMGILPELNKRFNVKYSRGFSNKLSLLPSTISLKKNIKDTQPQLLHSHLFYSSIIAVLHSPYYYKPSGFKRCYLQ